MSYSKYLEQVYQHLNSSAEASILTFQNEHQQRLSIINKEKEARLVKLKEEYDLELRSIDSRYPTQHTWSGYQETEKKKLVDRNYAKICYEHQTLSVEEEYEQKIKESEQVLSRIVLQLEADCHQKKLELDARYPAQMEEMKAAFSLTHKKYQTKIQEISVYYKEKSKKLHEGSTRTHSNLNRQLSDLKTTGVYHDSYRMLAKKIGLHGITDDVGTYVSKPSVFNDVQPIITYPDLCLELIRAYQGKTCRTVLDDFYTPSFDSPLDLRPLLASLTLNDSCDLLQKDRPLYKSSWYKELYTVLKSTPEFRQHIHNVMAQYNHRLIQSHGWESMPLTKIHLYSAFQLNESPFNLTAWHIISEEITQMQTVISSSYYEREKQLIMERDLALQEAKKDYERALVEMEKDFLACLQHDCGNKSPNQATQPHKEQPSPIVKESTATLVLTAVNSCARNQHQERFFTKPSKSSLPTIPENDDASEGNEDDEEICRIFKEARLYKS